MRSKFSALFLAGAVMVLVAACSIQAPSAPSAREVKVRANIGEGEFCRHGYVVGSGRDANGNPTDSTYTGCEEQ